MPSPWNQEFWRRQGSSPAARRALPPNVPTRRALPAPPTPSRRALPTTGQDLRRIQQTAAAQTAVAQSGQPLNVRTTGYSGVPGVDPLTGGGPTDRLGNPLQVFGDPNAPFATVAGNPNLYPYGTPLISPQFPNQQFSFRDTGTARGIRAGTTIDIATGSGEQMFSPQVNQPNVQFSPGYVTGPATPGVVNQPLYPAGTVATPQTPLVTGDINTLLYGQYGNPFAQPTQLNLGFDPSTAPQGLGFDTSFGYDLPPPPDTGAPGGFTPGIEQPPLTMATPDLSNLPPSALQASNVPGGALSMTDPGQIPSVEVGGGGPIGSAPSGASNYNYSPGPGGSTYVYDANWNYVDTIPGTQTPTPETTPPTPSTTDIPSAPALPVSDVTSGSPYSGQTPLTSFAPVQPATIGTGSFYGGGTNFGSASGGLYGGLEGGLSTGSVGGFSGAMSIGWGGGGGSAPTVRYL